MWLFLPNIFLPFAFKEIFGKSYLQSLDNGQYNALCIYTISIASRCISKKVGKPPHLICNLLIYKISKGWYLVMLSSKVKWGGGSPICYERWQYEQKR